METSDVITLNLNYRVEIITDMSIELLEACDNMDKVQLRDTALKFKNHFFGIWFRTRTMLQKYEHLIADVSKIDNFVSSILQNTRQLEVYSLLEAWSIYCHLLNESGITEMPLTSPLKQYAMDPGDE